MQSNTVISYVPYHYAIGRIAPYLSPGYAYASASRTAKSEIARPNVRPSVEQIVANGYFSIPSGDPITSIVLDKEHTSRLGLDDVISQVRRRYEIFSDNLFQIELAKCAAANAIYQSEAYAGPASSKQQYAKHKAIQDLYSDQRRETSELWRDVSRLRQLLPEHAQQYLAAYRTTAVLSQPAGDLE